MEKNKDKIFNQILQETFITAQEIAYFSTYEKLSNLTKQKLEFRSFINKCYKVFNENNKK